MIFKLLTCVYLFSGVCRFSSVLPFSSVCHGVSIELTFWNKTFVTLVALVRLLPSVDTPDVNLKTVYMVAWIWTRGTFVWPVSWMDGFVRLQIAGHGGRIFTLVTFIWLISRVDPFVFNHIIHCNWWIVALVTFMFLFSSVCHGVVSESNSIYGWIAALSALVWLLARVGHFVSL